MSPFATHQRRFEAGFTLLELLVVLFIVGMISLMAWPRLDRMPGAAVLQAASLQLGGQIRATRLAAIRTNRAQALTVDAAAGRYWSSVEPQPQALPPHVAVRIEGDCMARGGGLSVISFGANGSACDATIVLTDGRRSARLTIDWLTGAIGVTGRQTP